MKTVSGAHPMWHVGIAEEGFVCKDYMPPGLEAGNRARLVRGQGALFCNCLLLG